MQKQPLIVPLEIPIEGASVFSMFEPRTGNQPSLPAVSAVFLFLEGMLMNAAWVASALKVTPTIVSRWRSGVKKMPAEVGLVLGWCGTAKLVQHENFWRNTPKEIIEFTAKMVGRRLPSGWGFIAATYLTRQKELEEKAFAPLADLPLETYLSALDRSVKLGLESMTEREKMRGLFIGWDKAGRPDAKLYLETIRKETPTNPQPGDLRTVGGEK